MFTRIVDTSLLFYAFLEIVDFYFYAFLFLYSGNGKWKWMAILPASTI